MNRTAAVLVFAVLLAAALAAPAAASEPTPGLPTLFTLLTGSPEPGAEGADGVLLVPGTVIPVGSGLDAWEGRSAEVALAQSQVITGLADKLRDTMRLASMEVQYRSDRTLRVDEAVELPTVTRGSTVLPTVTLLGYNDDLATYRVTFTDGYRTLADTSVSIPFGRRSVVGGLDGEEAPYLFLVVEPPASKKAAEAEVARVTPPRVVEKAFPSYPEDAKKDKVQGVVIVQAVIDKDGTVSRVRAVKRLHPSLDEAALDAIRQWRFEPALLEGEPVAVHYNLTINFRLDNEKDG
jgi:TonB family protein